MTTAANPPLPRTRMTAPSPRKRARACLNTHPTCRTPLRAQLARARALLPAALFCLFTRARAPLPLLFCARCLCSRPRLQRTPPPAAAPTSAATAAAAAAAARQCNQLRCIVHLQVRHGHEKHDRVCMCSVHLHSRRALGFSGVGLLRVVSFVWVWVFSLNRCALHAHARTLLKGKGHTGATLPAGQDACVLIVLV